MIEKELRANWDNVFYPEPEPEVETFGEEVQPVDEPVLLAAGPSGTVSDTGAAFGVFPQMKPRRAGASEVGANLPLLAADVAAGTGKGLVSGVAGFPGDIAALGRGLYEIGKRGGDESALDAFLRGLQEGTVLPTSDDVDKWLTKNIGAVVPPGGPLQGAREAAAGVGRFVGETVADPFVAVKGAKAAAKGVKAAGKALAPKAGEMLSDYMRRSGMQLDLMAYHGTPHRFDKFDSSKIGTGEGAQAYGYGLYFAENKGVAEGYQIATSKDRFLTKDGFFDPSELEHLNVKAVTRRGDLDQAIAEARKYATPDSDYPETAAKAARDLARLEALKASGGIRRNKGALFSVDIPDALVAKMLDFDAPLGQQSPEIQALAQKYNLSMDDLGGDLLAAAGGKTAKGAQIMREAGIPGVRYLDQGSRGDGNGTRNIVVFPGGEDQVKILKREGQSK